MYFSKILYLLLIIYIIQSTIIQADQSFNDPSGSIEKYEFFFDKVIYKIEQHNDAVYIRFLAPIDGIDKNILQRIIREKLPSEFFDYLPDFNEINTTFIEEILFAENESDEIPEVKEEINLAPQNINNKIIVYGKEAVLNTKIKASTIQYYFLETPDYYTLYEDNIPYPKSYIVRYGIQTLSHEELLNSIFKAEQRGTIRIDLNNSENIAFSLLENSLIPLVHNEFESRYSQKRSAQLYCKSEEITVDLALAARQEEIANKSIELIAYFSDADEDGNVALTKDSIKIAEADIYYNTIFVINTLALENKNFGWNFNKHPRMKIFRSNYFNSVYLTEEAKEKLFSDKLYKNKDFLELAKNYFISHEATHAYDLTKYPIAARYLFVYNDIIDFLPPSVRNIDPNFVRFNYKEMKMDFANYQSNIEARALLETFAVNPLIAFLGFSYYIMENEAYLKDSVVYSDHLNNDSLEYSGSSHYLAAMRILKYFLVHGNLWDKYAENGFSSILFLDPNQLIKLSGDLYIEIGDELKSLDEKYRKWETEHPKS
ncbi:MAG: hypothetical protein ABIA04_08545 [Pseudomonadota bacterium]